jgi:two-component system, NarL family, nitrate/nitrite response regulator NarL
VRRVLPIARWQAARRRDRLDAVSILPSTVASVVVADDHPLYRAGIVRALAETRRFAISGEADDGERAYELIAARRPALAIVDVRMPRLDGLGVIARLAAAGIRVPVLLLSAFSEPEVVELALRSGAAGYVAKQADRDEIVAAAEAVAMGRPVRSAGQGDGRPTLPPIERHILRLLRAGWPVDEVPRLTGLNRAGVDRHVEHALSRLSAATVDDAVVSAMAWGLLD